MKHLTKGQISQANKACQEMNIPEEFRKTGLTQPDGNRFDDLGYAIAYKGPLGSGMAGSTTHFMEFHSLGQDLFIERPLLVGCNDSKLFNPVTL